MQRLVLLTSLSLLLAGCGRNSAPISSITSALNQGLSIECDYAYPQDGPQQKVFLGGKVIALRSGDNNIDQQNYAGLIKDNKVYLWMLTGGADGSVKDLTDLSQNNLTIAGNTIHSNDDVIKALEPYAQNCKTTSDTTLFDLPANINFK